MHLQECIHSSFVIAAQLHFEIQLFSFAMSVIHGQIPDALVSKRKHIADAVDPNVLC